MILRAPKMKTVTNVFALNLAIADGLFVLAFPANITEYRLQHWPFGEPFCKLVLTTDYYIYASVVMSVGCYLVVLATLPIA